MEIGHRAGEIVYRIVVVGTSMGGLHALEVLLSGLPADFELPVAAVQHRGVGSGSLLRSILQRHCPLKVREPNDKEPIRPGCVYLAPAGYHLMVEPEGFALSTGARVSMARPSVDVLFESAADTYGEGVIAVVMTGANYDGAQGARWVKQRGGTVLVQEPNSADTGMMPRAAMAATTVDAVLRLELLAPRLVELTRGVPA